jgi:hypothetical protein
MRVATTRRPQAARCNIACRRIWTWCIYGDGGERERDFRYPLLPGPYSSDRSCSLALANLPSGAPRIPGSLLLEASTWTNVLGNAWPLWFLVDIALPSSLLLLERVEGTGDRIVLMLVPGRGEDFPCPPQSVTCPYETCSEPSARLESLICMRYAACTDI